MEPISTLTLANGLWVAPDGQTFAPDAEGCLLIPAGVISADSFEVYPHVESVGLYLYPFSTYVCELDCGGFYLQIENCEHVSAELAELAAILEEWLAE
jgi:hypothetical protein